METGGSPDPSGYLARVRRPDVLAATGSAVLAGVGGLHVLWGLGAAWPAPDRARLAELVAGTDQVPESAACFVVGGGLAAAGALVAGAGGQRWPVRLARAGIAAGLLVRGLTGVTGQTRLLVPWTPSAEFQRLDRRRYGPFCLALGASIAASLRSHT